MIGGVASMLGFRRKAESAYSRELPRFSSKLVAPARRGAVVRQKEDKTVSDALIGKYFLGVFDDCWQLVIIDCQR